MKRISRPHLYLIIVVAAAILVWFLERPLSEKKGDILHKPFFEKLDMNAVTSIEIEHLLEGVKLKKENGEWKVAKLKTRLKENLEKAENQEPFDSAQGRPRTPASLASLASAGQARGQAAGQAKNQEPIWYPADGNKVNLSLEILTDLQATSLVGNNPEKHGSLEVNPAGMQLKFLNEKQEKIAHIYIGKTGAGYLESYVRKEGENEVYLTDRFLRASFPPDVDSWRNHIIWDIAEGNIEAIQIERDKNPFLLKKVDGKWKLINPKETELDSAKIENLVSGLSKIQASGFEEVLKPEFGLEKPILKIQLIASTGPLTLKIGKTKFEAEHYAQKEGDTQVYLIRDSVKKAIPEDWKELITK